MSGSLCLGMIRLPPVASAAALEGSGGLTLHELVDAVPDHYPKNGPTVRRDLEALDAGGFPLGAIGRSRRRKKMCHKTGGMGAPSAALRPGTIEMFLNLLGYLRFSSPVLWKSTHQFNELLGGGSGSDNVARNSATTSSRTVICMAAPGSLRTVRTSSGNRFRASLMENFMR